jgi:hypothetical protein
MLKIGQQFDRLERQPDQAPTSILFGYLALRVWGEHPKPMKDNDGKHPSPANANRGIESPVKSSFNCYLKPGAGPTTVMTANTLVRLMPNRGIESPVKSSLN